MTFHKTMKRLLASSLTTVIIGSTALSLPAAETAPVNPNVPAATPTPALPDHTFFLDGSSVNAIVNSMEEAAAVIENIKEKIGGDERTVFEPWRTLTDSKGNNYCVFMQMYSNVTVSGGAVKVVTDPEGKVLGIVSSVESDLPDAGLQEGIGAAEAQHIVTGHLSETGNDDPQLLDEYTEKVLLPVNLELDPESEEEKEEVRFVWSVYTDNDLDSITGSSELPYLAHYVTMDGEYLYSLPTIIPGDEAGISGYAGSYVFEFMEPAEYTGEVTLSDGTTKEISVTLMRDSRTGMYYLGNLERRIVVADCYEFLYNKGAVVMEASPDNTGWDDTCLLSLYNYCRAFDYYQEIGWTSGDGLGTPIMILKDYCDKNHTPIDNAAYAGKYYGWQLFLSSSTNDFSQCLDVLAHEFSHCVTGSVMTYNAYMNDYGAINEAISDIQGNICEMMTGATEDTTWELGENSSQPVRSMSDPHKYNQPEYTWDFYYTPDVSIPTDLNDRGGVHSNSSLLNRTAYLLCTEGGMTLEEARDFWFAVDCSMVPGTDYAQLSELMPWVLANIGLDEYLPSLREAMKETNLASKKLPKSFEDDRALVTMRLPDTEAFTDGNWALFILSADADEIMNRAGAIAASQGEYASSLEELKSQLFDAAIQFVFENEESDIFQTTLGEWLAENFKDLLYMANSSAGQDGRTISMICPKGYTIPLLLYLKFEPNSMKPSGIGLAVCLYGKWVDLSLPAADVANEIELEEMTAEYEDELSNDLYPAIDEIVNLVVENQDSGRTFYYEIKGGETCEIPSTGLEDVVPVMLDTVGATVTKAE